MTVFHSLRTSLDLIETLLNLSEAGHFDEVHQLFNFPLKHCPDILLFGVLQSKVGRWRSLLTALALVLVIFTFSSAPPPPLPHPSQPIWHTMQHELLSFLVPFFMANHPNSAGVLHFAWQGAAVSGVRRFARDEG